MHHLCQPPRCHRSTSFHPAENPHVSTHNPAWQSLSWRSLASLFHHSCLASQSLSATHDSWWLPVLPYRQLLPLPHHRIWRAPSYSPWPALPMWTVGCMVTYQRFWIWSSTLLKYPLLCMHPCLPCPLLCINVACTCQLLWLCCLLEYPLLCVHL